MEKVQAVDKISITKSYRALLAGATGLVGSALLKQMLGDSQCAAVTVLARTPAPKAPAARNGGKLRWIQASFDDIVHALEGVQADVVYCTLGTTIRQSKSREAFRRVDLSYTVELAKWAENNRAGAFAVVSSMGASASSRVFYSRVKGEMEQIVSGLSIPAIHIYRPSLLLGKRRELRIGERAGALAAQMTGFAFRGSLARYRPIKASTVAAAMRISVTAGLSYANAATGRAGSVSVHRNRSGSTIAVYESDAIADIAREITR